jgi:hypothetical protein
MATVEYGKYHLSSRPQKQDNGWVPFVLISWLDGKDLRSHAEKPDKVYATERKRHWPPAWRLRATG